MRDEALPPETDARSDAGLTFLYAICTVSGTLVLGAFLFPDLVGSFISGRGILVGALTFVGSLLVIISLIPDPEVRP